MSEFQPHIAETTRRNALLERVVPYVAGMSVALAFMAGKSGEASAQTAEASHAPRIVHCDLAFLNQGEAADCEPMGVPTSCVPEWAVGQLDQFYHDPKAMRQANAITPGKPHTRRASSTAPVLYGRKDKLRIGSQDEAAVVNNSDKKANAALFLGKAMGATEYRLIVHRNKFYDKIYRDRYDATVNAALKCGYDVQITLAGENYQWTERSAEKFGATVARHFRGRVYRYGSFNEPNYPGWLDSMPGKTQAETARIAYDGLRKGIKQGGGKKVQLFFGELSSMVYPAKFLKEAANARSTPLVTDECVSIHPYMFPSKKITKMPSLKNESVTANSRMIGVDGHHVYKQVIENLYKQGKLKTPKGKMPGLCYNEFALMSESPSEVRNMPEKVRTGIYKKLIRKFSGDSTVKNLTFYQMDYANEAWNSGFVNVFRHVMPAWYGVRDAVLANRRHIER